MDDLTREGATSRYLLDTNICVYVINLRPPHVFEHFRAVEAGNLMISSITGAELEYGVAKSGSARNHQALEKFLAPLEVAPFDDAAMRRYGRVRAMLEQRGTPIGPMDTLIAAHALALGCVLVTNNVREFARVPGLVLENWAEG